MTSVLLCKGGRERGWAAASCISQRAVNRRNNAAAECAPEPGVHSLRAPACRKGNACPCGQAAGLCLHNMLTHPTCPLSRHCMVIKHGGGAVMGGFEMVKICWHCDFVCPSIST